MLSQGDWVAREHYAGGIRTEPSGAGFRTMELAFSVSVSATNIWRFPPLDFCFLRDLSASSSCQCFGIFDGQRDGTAQPQLHGALADAAGGNLNHIFAKAGNLLFDFRPRAVANAKQGNE